MAITSDQFDALVQKLEGFAQQHPRIYQLRVGLFAILGYFYIFLVLGILLGLFLLFVGLMVVSRSFNYFIIKLGVLSLVPAWMILASLRVNFPPPDGLRLTRKQVPNLFALVDELTEKLQTPRFHNILLVGELNAAVKQIPRLGIFGWQENYLILGLPLMQALSLDQFKTVLAHEFGHLSGNHSRFGGWIYRLRNTWLQIYQRLHNSEHQGSMALFNDFLEWYWPRFNAYSFTLGRMNEYEADRCAAQLAGADHAAEALIHVALKSQFLQHTFWSDLNQQIEHQPDPPGNAYSLMFTALHQPLPLDQQQQWISQALKKMTNNDDTHPCLRDRLAALGYTTDAIAPLLRISPPATTAAEQLLGSALPELTQHFDQEWQAEASTPWRQRYAYLQELQANLQMLEEKRQAEGEAGLSELEEWTRVYYTLELRGEAVAMPLAQEFLSKYPNNVTANYTLGQLLLAKGDPAGVPLIERAIAHEPAWTVEAYQLLEMFYIQHGQVDAVKACRQQLDAHYNLLAKAQYERSTLRESDRFKPHSCTADEVAAIVEQLKPFRRITQIYLVEKVLDYYPEQRFVVVGLIRQKSFIEVDDGAKQLLSQVLQTLELPTDGFVAVLNDQSILKKKIIQVDGALVFQR